MKTLTLIFCLLAGIANATSYFYISPSGNNSSGTSWASAWRDGDQINWSAVSAGDTIYVDAGTYTKKLRIEKSVTVRKSTETGRSGTAHWKGQIQVYAKGATLDGFSPDRFIVYPTDSMCGLFVGYWTVDATGSRVRNITLQGTYATVSGISLSVYSPDCLIENCVFDQSPGEDMLAIMTAGNVTIKGCTFRNLVGSGTAASHRDAISVYPGINPGKVLTLTGCQFLNNRTDNFTCFPNQGAILGGFLLTGNFWKDGNTSIHFDSRLAKADFIRVEGNNWYAMDKWIVNDSLVPVQTANNQMANYPPSGTSPAPTLAPTLAPTATQIPTATPVPTATNTPRPTATPTPEPLNINLPEGEYTIRISGKVNITQ